LTNAGLAGLLGLLALIGLLAMIQSRQLTLTALLPTTPAGTKQSKASAKGRAPQLFPRQAPAAATPVRAGAEQPVPEINQRQPRRELYQALARMDADTAADMLMELDADAVTELLLALRERDLSRILEAAPPVEAAQWVAGLLDAAPPLEPPPATEQPAVPAGGDAAQPVEMADPAGIGSTDESTQETADGSFSQAEPVPQDGADADESAVSNGSAAGNEPPRLPPDTTTA